MLVEMALEAALAALGMWGLKENPLLRPLIFQDFKLK